MKTPPVVKSDLLEWSNGANKHVLTGDAKRAVKFLRKLHTGYAKYDLRKPIHANTVRKIENDLNQFFALSDRPHVTFVRPAIRNRKLYRDAAQQYGGWKVFAVPRQSDEGKLRVRRFGGKKVLAEVGLNVEYIKLYFNKKRLVKHLADEVARLYRIAREGDAQLKFARILVGEYVIGARFLTEKLIMSEIEKLMLKYNTKDANNNWHNWLDGLEFARFTNQTVEDDSNVKKRRKRKTRRQKIRGR